MSTSGSVKARPPILRAIDNKNNAIARRESSLRLKSGAPEIAVAEHQKVVRALREHYKCGIIPSGQCNIYTRNTNRRGRD